MIEALEIEIGRRLYDILTLYGVVGVLTLCVWLLTTYIKTPKQDPRMEQ